MQVYRYANAQDFLKHSQAWLLEAEPENNLMLGVACRSSGDKSNSSSQEFWATVLEGDDVLGTSFRTPPHHLAVSRMPPHAIPLLAQTVRTVYRDLSGVAGPAEVAEPFARLWTQRYGGSWRCRFRQRIHVLLSVQATDNTPDGRLRPMEESDEELIRRWMGGFVRDTGVTVLPESFVDLMIKKRDFYLWEDGAPRCMLAKGRETPNGACITVVYTPDEQRRKGYATAAVAQLSRTMLSSGREFCCLYTDMDNPTSNSIYRRIGYVPIRDDLELVFEVD